MESQVAPLATAPAAFPSPGSALPRPYANDLNLQVQTLFNAPPRFPLLYPAFSFRSEHCRHTSSREEGDREAEEAELGAMNSKAWATSQDIKASPKPRRNKVSSSDANPRPFAVLSKRLALCLGKLAAFLRTRALSLG